MCECVGGCLVFVVNDMHSVTSGLSHTRSHLRLTAVEVNEATSRLQFIIVSSSSAQGDKVPPSTHTRAHVS